MAAFHSNGRRSSMREYNVNLPGYANSASRSRWASRSFRTLRKPSHREMTPAKQRATAIRNDLSHQRSSDFHLSRISLISDSSQRFYDSGWESEAPSTRQSQPLHSSPFTVKDDRQAGTSHKQLHVYQLQATLTRANEKSRSARPRSSSPIFLPSRQDSGFDKSRVFRAACALKRDPCRRAELQHRMLYGNRHAFENSDVHFTDYGTGRRLADHAAVHSPCKNRAVVQCSPAYRLRETPVEEHTYSRFHSEEDDYSSSAISSGVQDPTSFTLHALSSSCLALSGSFSASDEDDDVQTVSEFGFDFLPQRVVMANQLSQVTLDSDATAFMNNPICRQGVVECKSRERRRNIFRKLRHFAKSFRRSSAGKDKSELRTLAIL